MFFSEEKNQKTLSSWFFPRSRPWPAGLGGRAWNSLDFILAALGLWLAGSAPISFAGGTYDDLLYIRLANSIAQGHWLGPFGQLTLARGPMFPIFLAGAALCRIPVNLACQAVILAGSLLLARFAGRALASRPAATAIFALLALNPVPWSLPLALVMREKLYIGETLLTLGVAIHCLPPGPHTGRAGWPGFFWAFATGIVFAAFWLTREEGVWMIPPLAVILLLRVGADLRQHLRIQKSAGPAWVLRESLFCVLPVLGFCTIVLPLASINYVHYGVFRTNDFQTGPFPDAYGAMLRVKPAHWQRYVFLPRDVRLALYRVSPAARELQPALEGALGRSWTRIGCANSWIPDCDDLQGGWAMLAVRDAVDAAGHYRSAAEADRFYKRLAREINASCRLKQLHCTGRRSGMLPPYRAAYLGPTLHSFWDSALATVSLQDAQPGPLLVTPSLFDLAESAPIALGPEAPTLAQAEAPTQLLFGWLDALPGDPAELLSVALSDGQDGALMAGPDATIPQNIGRPGSRAMRFQLRCKPDCRLHVGQSQAPGAAALLDTQVSALRPGLMTLSAGMLLNIDIARRVPPHEALLDVPFRVSLAVARVVRKVGGVIMPISVLAVPAILLAGLWRRHLQRADLLAAILLVALISRLAVLAVGDATTMPAQDFRFHAPGMMIALALAGVVSARLAVRAARALSGQIPDLRT